MNSNCLMRSNWKLNMMGCSSSMSVPLSSEKMPLHYSGNSEDHSSFKNHDMEIDSNSEEQEKDLNTGKHRCDISFNKTKSGDNIHINNAQILIISRDSRDHDSTDASSVVPIFNNNEHDRNMTSCSPCLSACSQLRGTSAGRDSRSMSLPGGIKSVLKTGRNDPQSHMLANRPIKTVTFVESVTVVTVY